MSKIDGGATLWARQTIESDIFYNKPHAWFKIWFYLVNKANHKDNKLFKRGTCFMKYEWIMEKTKATSSQIKHCIEYLKHARQIATQKKTRGLLVTIIKYDFYQTLNNYYYAESQTERKTKGKQKENKSHTILKNDKNDKNDKKKREYAPLVFMTEEEHQKLLSELGDPLTKEYIKDLSLYLQSKGKRYKSHYATILAWHRKDEKEGKVRKPADEERKPKYIPTAKLTPEQMEVNKRKVTEMLNKLKAGVDMPIEAKGGKGC